MDAADPFFAAEIAILILDPYEAYRTNPSLNGSAALNGAPTLAILRPMVKSGSEFQVSSYSFRIAEIQRSNMKLET
jgi:hypothetical protein